MSKKGIGGMWEVIIGAVVVLIVIIWAISLVKYQLIDKQGGFVGQQTELLTEDCDSDGAQGISDDCPCSADVQKLGVGEQCPDHDEAATEKCSQVCTQ